jgi:hypothetical protein
LIGGATHHTRFVVAGCALVAALGAAACGGGGGGDPEPRERVDEHAGRFRGVAIGDRSAQVRHRLGPPRPYNAQGRIPGGESTIPYLSAGGGLSYKGAFYAVKDKRVTAIIAYGDGAGTTNGVGIGDPLGDAQKKYREADCHAEELGDPTRDAYWEVQTGKHLWLWLGGDPIDNIVVSIVRPSG